MNSPEQRAARYDFLRKQSYSLLWNPHMCDLFLAFESDLPVGELLRSPELLAQFREAGTARGIKGSAELTFAEVYTGTRNGVPLISDFVWRSVSHVVHTLLSVPRDSVTPVLSQDLRQEMLLELVRYEPQFNPNAPNDGKPSTLEGYFFAYPVKRSCDGIKRLVFGGRSVGIEKSSSISLEGRFGSGNGHDGQSEIGMDDLLADASAVNSGMDMDTAMLSEKIFGAMEDCTPKEKDTMILCLLMLGETDVDTGRIVGGISKEAIWQRRQVFEKSFQKLLRESLAQESVSGISDSDALAEEMCYGRADGRSIVDSRMTHSPEIDSLQWGKMDSLWEELLGDENR
jgi:hypothetical protein